MRVDHCPEMSDEEWERHIASAQRYVDPEYEKLQRYFEAIERGEPPPESALHIPLESTAFEMGDGSVCYWSEADQAWLRETLEPAEDLELRPVFWSYSDFRQWLQRLEKREPPEHVRHVVFDADDTMWEGLPFSTAASYLPGEGKLDKKDKDVVKYKTWEGKDAIFRLDPTLRRTLAELDRRGIGYSVASWNPPGSVRSLLKEYGLADRFKDIIESYELDKDMMVKTIAEKQGVDTKDIIFVNDSPEAVYDVTTQTDAYALAKGLSIQYLDEILELLPEGA